MDSQSTDPEIIPGINLVLYSAGRGGRGGGGYVLFRTCPYFSVLVRTRLRNNNRQHKTFRNMVRKKIWEHSVSLELFSSTLRTILRKTRILLGQCGEAGKRKSEKWVKEQKVVRRVKGRVRSG